MSVYKRTKLGDQELLQRQLRLSARARTLLLLLESEDLKQMSVDALEKIASPQNYQILLSLNLIEDLSSNHVVSETHQTSNPFAISPNKSDQINSTANINTPSVSAVEQAVTNSSQQINPTTSSIAIEEKEAEIPVLEFVEIKRLMQHTLKQYCGLMAKSQINAIDQANSTYDIRQHQSKWLTTLFETRISRQQLNELLRLINYSIEKIESE